MNFKLFKNSTFNLFIFGSIVTLMGDTFLDMALALYVLKVTLSAAKYSFVIAIAALPTIILGPISGSLVDRLNKKKLLIFLDSIRGIILIVFVLLIQGKEINLYSIYILAFIFGVCDSIYRPCVNTVIPSIVEENDLVSANTIYMMLLQVGLIIAPSIAVLLYDKSGINFVFIVDAITFFIMAFIAIFYKLKKSENVKQENKKSGFKLFKDRELLSLSINGTITYLLVLPLFSVGLPFIIKNLFNGTDGNYATIQTIISLSAVGIIVTVPIISKKMKEIKAVNFSMYGMLISIIPMFLLSNTNFFNYIKSNSIRGVIFLGIVSFAFYLAFSTYGVFFQTINQKKVDNSYFGRYYSILLMLFGIGNVLGNAIFGFLYDIKVLFYPIGLAVIGVVLKLVLNSYIKPMEDEATLQYEDESVNS